MKSHILYQSYNENEPYIFLMFDKKDRQTASILVNRLIEKQFRVCYNEHDNKTISNPDWLANRILFSEIAIFFVSVASTNSLEFRNSINYAISKGKKIVCIYIDDNELEYGFDMQLSNIPKIKLSEYKCLNQFCEDIVKKEFFSQVMRGEDAKIVIKNNRKKTFALIAISSVLALFLIFGSIITVNRINYESSLAGEIEKQNEKFDYLDISEESFSIIELLKDKTVKKLVASNMGLTDIEAFQYVNCEELDLSQNPKINTLEPLLNIKNLKVVLVTQDMYPAIVRISGSHQFKIIIID